MRVPNSKIYKAVAKEGENRLVLTQVFFDKDNERLVASDGFVMAVVPVDDIAPNDVGGLIDPDAFKMARKHGNGHLVADDEHAVVLDTSWKVKRDIGTYPDYESILKNRTNADKAAPVLVLSALKLYRLAQAICETPRLGVRIFLPQKPNEGIQVRPEIENGARGILMPQAHPDNEDIDLTGVARALANDEEITPDMREMLKRLLGVSPRNNEE